MKRLFSVLTLIFITVYCTVGERPPTAENPKHDNVNEDQIKGLTPPTNTISTSTDDAEAIDTKPFWYRDIRFPHEITVRQILFDIENDITYLGTGTGVFKSEGEQEFRDASPIHKRLQDTDDGDAQKAEFKVVEDFIIVDSNLFAAYRYIGLFRSTDYGGTWQLVDDNDNSNLEKNGVIRLLATPDKNIYSLSRLGRVKQSSNMGGSWKTLGELSNKDDPLIDMQVLTNPLRVFALTRNQLYVDRNSKISNSNSNDNSYFQVANVNFTFPAEASSFYIYGDYVYIYFTDSKIYRAELETLDFKYTLPNIAFNFSNQGRVPMKKVKGMSSDTIFFIGGTNGCYASKEVVFFANIVNEKDVEDLLFMNIFDIVSTEQNLMIGSTKGLFFRKLWW